MTPASVVHYVYAVVDQQSPGAPPIKIKNTRREARDWAKMRDERDTLRVRRCKLTIYGS